MVESIEGTVKRLKIDFPTAKVYYDAKEDEIKIFYPLKS